MKQKTFIVPHDFTNVADVALAHAIATAKLSDTVIQLLHVVTRESEIKEAINTIEAPSIEVALNYFAKMKKLSESEFSQIYSIGIKNK